MASAASIAVQLQKLSNQATKQSFDYNRKEANTARSWQEKMSNTAHQREVADLKKAGLNPVLATNQGAQSYTTAAASAQAENAANAVGNVWSSQIGADATRAAAAESARATRYAAAQNAAAMRYAAAMSYQEKKDSYSWQRENMKAEYKEKTKYMKSEYGEKLKLPVNNVSALIDKYATRSGLADTALSTKVVKGAISGFGNLINNPSKAIKSTVSKFSKTSPYNDLNYTGKSKINSALTTLGIRANSTTRNLLANAIFNGKSSSWNTLKTYMPKKTSHRVNSARAIHIR